MGNAPITYQTTITGKEKLVTPSATKLVVQFDTTSTQAGYTFIAQFVGVIIQADVSQGLYLVQIGKTLKYPFVEEVRKQIEKIRVLPVFLTEDSQEEIFHPRRFYVEVGAFDDLDEYALTNSNELSIEKIDDVSAHVFVRNSIRYFELMDRVLNLQYTEFVEPEKITFTDNLLIAGTDAEMEKYYLKYYSSIWGDLSYPRKTLGDTRTFDVVPGLFTLRYNKNAAGESPITAIESEGLQVQQIDEHAATAVVSINDNFVFSQSSFADGGISFLNSLTKIFGVSAKSDVVEEQFPVLRDLSSGHIDLVSPGFFCVAFNERARLVDAFELLEKHQVTVQEYMGENEFRCSLNSASQLFTALAPLASEKIVIFIEPDFVTFRPDEHVPNDPLFPMQWNSSLVKATEAWDVTQGASNVIIVIPDQGVDLTHTDLSGQFISREGEDWNFVESANRSPHEPARPHGTAIAGVVSALQNDSLVAGHAAACKILPIRLYTLSLTTITLTRCLRYIRKYAAKNERFKYVVSMSFGVSDSEGVRRELRRGEDIGIFYCASAGNKALADTAHYPSDYDQVMSVAAVGPNDAFAENYSNYGANIDLTAPGGLGLPTQSDHNVLTLMPRSRAGRTFGTSFAAPHVAACAALTLAVAEQNRKDLTPDEIRKIILDNCDNVDAVNPNYSGLLGFGRLNIASSLSDARLI